MATLIEKASNLTKAIIDFVLAGAPVVSQRVYQKRLEICQDCPKRTDGWNCSVCGCHIPIKAKMATESCPIRKWVKTTGMKTEQESGGCGGCKKKKPA